MRDFVREGATSELYDLLGVKRDASPDELRRAYRKLAKQYHPDLNPNDKAAEEKFKALTAAYDLLSDPDMRARYDHGDIDASGQPRRGPQFEWGAAGAGARRQPGPDPDVDLGDIFNEFFGGYRDARNKSGPGADKSGPKGAGRKQAGPGGGRFAIKGADIQYSMTVEFLDAARGASRRVTMHDGRVLDINIPAGLKSGQTLRLKGQGMPGVMGGEAGDALVEIEVRPHPIFERDDNAIKMELPISLTEAIKGGSVEVPTITGTVTMNVPAGSNSGRVLRLKGKGIKGDDQFVTLKIVLPKTIDRELEQFIQRWTFADYNPRKH